MEIFKENSFTAEAQKRLAAQKGKLEQTRDSLRQGELLMIDLDVLPRRVGRLISNPLVQDALATQPQSVREELSAYANMPTPTDNVEGTERLQQLSQQARGQLEAIIGGNDLLPIWFLNRGAELRRTVARIKVVTSDGAESFGTGFLIGPGVLITNRHVLDQSDLGKDSLVTIVTSAVAEFDVEIVPERTPTGQTRFASSRPIVFRLEPQSLLLTDDWNKLDYVLVALETKSLDGQHDINEYGYNRLAADMGKRLLASPCS